MPSVLYSTTCYVKNNLYRLRLCTYVDEKDQNSGNAQLVTDSSDFTATDIPTDAIIPSLTRLNFELVNDKKTTTIPKSIPLNHLLKVEQTNSIPNRNRREFYNSNDTLNTNDTLTPAHKPLEQTSSAILNRNISEVSTSQPISTRRQFSLARFFSNQSYADSETNLISKTVIKISYVDVSNSVQWVIKRLELEIETEDIANELHDNLKRCLLTLKQRPHHLLVFVNPFGGKGQANYVYQKKVLPIFKEANITVDVIYTERAKHAQDYVINNDISNYDGLICVGGDGIFAELCHGLLLRTSYEKNLDIDDPKINIIQPNLRIGIIPAGSTDAIVFGTTGINDPVTSALQIVIGESLSIDIATVHNEKGFVRFMAAMLAYGFFGDIIHLSDKWRCLGPIRYDLAGFVQFIRNKSYHTKLTMTLAPRDSLPSYPRESTSSINNSTGEVILSVPSDSPQFSNNINSTRKDNNQMDSSFNVIHKLVTPIPAFCSRHCETCAKGKRHEFGDVHSPLQVQCEGRYTTINCLNMPGRCAKSKFGMSPFVHLGDGSFDLILVKRSWITGFLRFLYQVANDSRSIEDLPNVERYRVSEVLIQPVHTDPKHIGNWGCDGDIISGNEIQIRIHRQALNLFASGIHFDKIEKHKPVKKTKTQKCCPCFRFNPSSTKRGHF